MRRADGRFDNASGTGESIDRCHRSKSAEIHIGGGKKTASTRAVRALAVMTATGDTWPGLTSI